MAKILWDGIVRQFLKNMNVVDVPIDIMDVVQMFCEMDTIYDYLNDFNIRIDDHVIDEMEMNDDIDVSYDLNDYNFVRFYIKYRFEILDKRKIEIYQHILSIV